MPFSAVSEQTANFSFDPFGSSGGLGGFIDEFTGPRKNDEGKQGGGLIGAIAGAAGDIIRYSGVGGGVATAGEKAGLDTGSDIVNNIGQGILNFFGLEDFKSVIGTIVMIVAGLILLYVGLNIVVFPVAAQVAKEVI